MNALIIGATGFVGSALDGALKARGHHTVGTARTERARRMLEARGTTPVWADAARPETLAGPIAEADAVVYAVAAANADPLALDRGALRAIKRGLAGTEKTFVYVSGTYVYGATAGAAAMEESSLAPPPHFARRVQSERATLAMSELGIRAFVVRPGIVYGHGGGIPAMFGTSVRERGAATIVGDGTNRWATIDVDDLGRLLALVIERGRPGRAYNAVNDDRFSLAQIAAAGSRGAGAGGATTHVAPARLGPLGEYLALDQLVANDRAKTDLGWAPHGSSICQDLEAGSYTYLRVAV